MKHKRLAAALVGVGVVAAACGTQAPSAGGDVDLPNALAGPFRVLRKDELRSTAPFILPLSAGEYKAPTVVVTDAATRQAALYAHSIKKGFAPVIYRIEIDDARLAQKDRKLVLAKGEPWEGDTGITDPSALLENGQTRLYYAAGGCIGVATSGDGVMFEKRASGPLLCPRPGAWDESPLRGPAVVRDRDGTLRLFYESGGLIGEAISIDGETFERRGMGPVLTPTEGAPLEADAEVDESFDSAWVGDPHAVVATTALGRPVTYLYFTGQNRLGRTAVGMAARVGDGTFVKNRAPALSRYDANAPCVVRLGDITMLYTSGRSSEAADTFTQAIIGAMAPANASLVLPPVEADAGDDGGKDGGKDGGAGGKTSTK